MLPPMSSDGLNLELAQLRVLASKLARVESDALSLRRARDEEIQRVVHRAGVSERDAAGAAGVSRAYAHKAAVHGRSASRV